MKTPDDKMWLRSARAIANKGTNSDELFDRLRSVINDLLDAGESIDAVVRSWDSLERNPNDQLACDILHAALDAAVSRVRCESGTAIGLTIHFTLQFKENFSFQREDLINLQPSTVDWVTDIFFRNSVGKPRFGRGLIQQLQLAVATLTPDRLGGHFRTQVSLSLRDQHRCHDRTFVPPYPDGVIHTIHSKPDEQRPYIVFTALLSGYLWFNAGVGEDEITRIWMKEGLLNDPYDFAPLDKICAKVHEDVRSQFPDIISTKMNAIPMRFMSGRALSRWDRSMSINYKKPLREAGLY